MITDKSFFTLRALAVLSALALSTNCLPTARAQDAGTSSPAPAQPPPKTWIDPETGHRVIRLTDEPGSDSFYFNVNPYTPDGKEMAYTTADRSIGVVDLADPNFKTRIAVHGPVGAIVVGHKTPTIYYSKRSGDAGVSELWCANLDTGVSRKIADLPPRASVVTINCDETLGVGTFVEGEATGASIYGGKKTGTYGRTGSMNMGEPANKTEMMAKRLSERLPMTMFTVDLNTGKTSVIMEHQTDWLNHMQFSPVDPNLVMYCHEGSGWRVDRIWTVRTDGTEITMIPDEPGRNRIMQTELAGHEWWSPDGRTIYVDLHLLKAAPADGYRGGVGFLAEYNLDTKIHTWYHYEQNEWQIHFNLSPDGKTFCGDGAGRPGNQWIYLLHPVVIPDDQTMGTDLIHGGYLEPEKLCSLSKTAIHGAHRFALEPNASFTPDQKYIVFRSNIFGPDYAFAVEVAKASTP